MTAVGMMLRITNLTQHAASVGFAGHYLESPRHLEFHEASGVALRGWALGASRAAREVEVLVDGRAVCRTPLRAFQRPDLTVAFPEQPWANDAAFETSIPVLGRTREVVIDVVGVAVDGSRSPVATLEGRRCWSSEASPHPLVSVVIPCFNQAHYLGEAVESALNQTYPLVEVVVVDDGSTDNTASTAERFPVRCVRQPNRGLARARNTGIRESVGEYIVFLDADDRLLPGAIEHALAAFDQVPEAALVFGRYRKLSATGQRLEVHERPQVRGDVYEALLRENVMGMPGTGMYRRPVFQHLRGFDPESDACADYELALRLARDFPVADHHEEVVEYRVHASSMSRDHALMLRDTMRIHRRHRPAGDSHVAQAWYEGRQGFAEWYGPLAVRQLDRAWTERKLPQAAKCAATLLRWSPSLLGRALAEMVRANAR